MRKLLRLCEVLDEHVIRTIRRLRLGSNGDRLVTSAIVGDLRDVLFEAVHTNAGVRVLRAMVAKVPLDVLAAVLIAVQIDLQQQPSAVPRKSIPNALDALLYNGIPDRWMPEEELL